ncbi:hypothetical protein [Bryobacter aggregatus]|uniref:hypothetical protein n=1 Tax=Bryobacter aggregatus TaxID=360054 RepID=UPI0006916482|nr:hypothetical protein [Bryobacter aggregatus]
MGVWTLNPLVIFARVREGNETCAWVGLLHFAVLAVVLVAMRFDHRELLGVNIWLKPAKFLISSGLYLWTLGWLLNYVEASAFAQSLLGGGASILILLENVAIVTQAARGVRSHFNAATGLDATVFTVMGVLIITNTVLIAILFWWFCVKPAPLSAAALWGCRLGALLAVLASIEGGYMVFRQAHTLGAPDGSAGIPVLNWSKEAGDLRIAHFIGLHGLQVLPLAGFWLGELGATAGIFILAALHYLAFFLTFLQAVAKKPLFF